MILVEPAVERKATDRAHRIGTDESVFVYKLIAQDTVEERCCSCKADDARSPAASIHRRARRQPRWRDRNIVVAP